MMSKTVEKIQTNTQRYINRGRFFNIGLHLPPRFHTFPLSLAKINGGRHPNIAHSSTFWRKLTIVQYLDDVRWYFKYHSSFDIYANDNDDESPSLPLAYESNDGWWFIIDDSRFDDRIPVYDVRNNDGDGDGRWDTVRWWLNLCGCIVSYALTMAVAFDGVRECAGGPMSCQAASESCVASDVGKIMAT